MHFDVGEDVGGVKGVTRKSMETRDGECGVIGGRIDIGEGVG